MAKDTMIERTRRPLAERSEGLLSWPGRWGWPDLFDWAEPRTIRVEEGREDGRIVVRAELPGVDPERDIAVEVLDGVLTIRAERRERSEQREAQRTRSEFRYGWFSRSLGLPEGCEVDDIEARYHDGILEVRVPVSENERMSKAIEVKVDRE